MPISSIHYYQEETIVMIDGIRIDRHLLEAIKLEQIRLSNLQVDKNEADEYITLLARRLIKIEKRIRKILKDNEEKSQTLITKAVGLLENVQQSKFGQVSNKKRRNMLPHDSVQAMKSFFDANLDYPYPSEFEVNNFANRYNITPKQVITWFTNARKRKPWHRNCAKLDTTTTYSEDDQMETRVYSYNV